jgi:hypothetical protein
VLARTLAAKIVATLFLEASKVRTFGGAGNRSVGIASRCIFRSAEFRFCFHCNPFMSIPQTDEDTNAIGPYVRRILFSARSIP